jgi:hypothetical protein
MQGVIPDATPESLDKALEEAHEHLPCSPTHRVELGARPLEEALADPLTLHLIGGDEGVALVRATAAEVGGDDPHLVLAALVPRDGGRCGHR